jgi:hypothetical protein
MSALGRVVGTLLAVQAMGASQVEISVQVYNPAAAPKTEVQKALGEAGWILSQAGIEAQWVECGDSVRDGADLPGCQPRTEPGLFVVSILSEDPRRGRREDALGFAVLAGRKNGAAVVYSHIRSILRDNPQYADCNLLGHVIAHELGHLLLRSPQHGDGIMKADWKGRDFEAMKQRRLRFSLAEARRLVSMPCSQTASAKLSPTGSD